MTNSLSETTEYEYDLAGNLTRQEEAGGRVVTYTYNVRGLPITKTEGTLSEAYAYYPDGKLQTKTSKGGIIATYVYDVHGNVLSEDAGGEEYTYTYDGNGNVLTQTDLTGTTTRVYDELNRVTSKTVPVIGTSTFNYDIVTGYGMAAGEYAERTTDPKGNITIKVFDKAGRLLKVYDSELATSTVYAYDKAGRRTTLTYPNGACETYEYDEDDKLVTLKNYLDGDPNPVDQYTYTYDANHNQLTKNETINNVVKGQTTYTYDDLNRLETVTEPSNRVTEYIYDDAGNREIETITEGGNTTVKTYTYDTQTNRLIDMQERINGVLKFTENYVYDDDGNLTSKTTINHENSTQSVVTYEYDNRNELTLSTSGSDTVTNAYNAEGLRVSKVSYTGGNTTTEKYLYEGSDIILTVNASNVQTARNVWGVNLISRTASGVTVYMMYNGHKDVTALVDGTGVIVGTYYYDAFGVVLSKTGTNDNPYGYSGYEYDDETGLYYLKARFYDPATARFLQEDIYLGNAADPLSLNLYTYCQNNPIIYWDPTGHIMAGDEQYDKATQAKIVEKTYEYYATNDPNERARIYAETEAIRKNGTKYDDDSRSTPIVKNFTNALKKSTNFNADGSTFIDSSTWFKNTNMDKSKGKNYGSWVGVSSFFSHGYNSNADEFNKMVESLSDNQSFIDIGTIDNRTGEGLIKSDDYMANEIVKQFKRDGLSDKEINIKLNQLGYSTTFKITYKDKYGKTDDQIDELSSIIDRYTGSNQSVDVIGHSRGGLVSIGYAAYNSNKVNAVITIDTPYFINTEGYIANVLGLGRPASTELAWDNSEIEQIQAQWNSGAYKKVRAYAIASNMEIITGIPSGFDGVVSVYSQKGGNFKGIKPIEIRGSGLRYFHTETPDNPIFINKVSQLIVAR